MLHAGSWLVKYGIGFVPASGQRAGHRREANREHKTLLMVLLAVSAVAGCVSSEPTARAPEPSDDAADTNYQLGAQLLSQRDLRARRKTGCCAPSSSIRARPPTHSLLALTYIELDNPRLANESFNRAVRLEPNNKDVRNAYAVYLCQRREYDEGAMEQFDRAIGDSRQRHGMDRNDQRRRTCVAQKPDLERAEQYFAGTHWSAAPLTARR